MMSLWGGICWPGGGGGERGRRGVSGVFTGFLIVIGLGSFPLFGSSFRSFFEIVLLK